MIFQITRINRIIYYMVLQTFDVIEIYYVIITEI